MDVKKMFSQMQNQLLNTQKKLDSLEISESVGGDQGVFLKMNGNFKLLDIKISFIPRDQEDTEMLEDMLKKAFLGCHKQVEQEIKKQTAGMM